MTAILSPCSVDLSICSRSVVFPLPCLHHISIWFAKRRLLSTYQKSRKQGDGKRFNLAVLLHFVPNLGDVWIGCTSRKMHSNTRFKGQEIRGEVFTIAQMYCSLTWSPKRALKVLELSDTVKYQLSPIHNWVSLTNSVDFIGYLENSSKRTQTVWRTCLQGTCWMISFSGRLGCELGLSVATKVHAMLLWECSSL